MKTKKTKFQAAAEEDVFLYHDIGEIISYFATSEKKLINKMLNIGFDELKKYSDVLFRLKQTSKSILDLILTDQVEEFRKSRREFEKNLKLEIDEILK